MAKQILRGLGTEEFRARFYEQTDRVEAPFPELQGDCLLWNRGAAGSGYVTLSRFTFGHRVHVLSWEMHHGKQVSGGLFIAHLCNRPLCIQPFHLDAQTHEENMAYAVKCGRTRQGSSHYIAKLDEEQVTEMRALAAYGVMQKDLAVQFGVGRSQVGKIVRRENWKHIP